MIRKIKITIVVVALILFALKSHLGCQSYRIDRIFLTSSLTVVGGFSYGVGETLIHHHSTSVFSGAPQTSFFGSRSWERKYRNYPHNKAERFPGSKTILVGATDGYHLSRTLSNLSRTMSIVTYKPPPKRWHKIIDFAIIQASFSAGFHLSQIITRK